jgi:hypothetical protein
MRELRPWRHHPKMQPSRLSISEPKPKWRTAMTASVRLVTLKRLESCGDVILDRRLGQKLGPRCGSNCGGQDSAGVRKTSENAVEM